MTGKDFSRAANRIKRELMKLAKDEALSKQGISVETLNDNFVELEAQILGPNDTPYEGGNYILDIKIPSAYPFKPPEIRFATKIWHPNVSSVTGAICLNILKDEWVALLGLRTTLISVQALLSAAEPDDPQDAIVARQCREDPELFNLTAKHWAHIYAGAPQSNPEFEKKIESLVKMGVEEERALIALSSSFWDLSNAVDFIYR